MPGERGTSRSWPRSTRIPDGIDTALDTIFPRASDRYRQSLDDQLPNAPRAAKEFTSSPLR
jgi:hypothetical protein